MRDDIIRMAREAGFVCDEADFVYPKAGRRGLQLELERFAAFVRADEREACAKVCEDLHPGLATRRAAEIIRARGQA